MSNFKDYTKSNHSWFFFWCKFVSAFSALCYFPSVLILLLSTSCFLSRRCHTSWLSSLAGWGNWSSDEPFRAFSHQASAIDSTRTSPWFLSLGTGSRAACVASSLILPTFIYFSTPMWISSRLCYPACSASHESSVPWASSFGPCSPERQVVGPSSETLRGHRKPGILPVPRTQALPALWNQAQLLSTLGTSSDDLAQTALRLAALL